MLIGKLNLILYLTTSHSGGRFRPFTCQASPLVYLTEADLPEEQEGPHPILNLTALKVKLHLPSHLDPSIRQQCCPSNIVQTEIRLSFAVAEDALRDLRKYLTAKKTLVNYKIKHVSGPGRRANTRARAIIDRFQSRINHSADKYRASRNALALLDPDGSQTMQLLNINWSHCFKLLTTQDVVFLNEDPDSSDEEGASREAQSIAKKKEKVGRPAGGRP